MEIEFKLTHAIFRLHGETGNVIYDLVKDLDLLSALPVDYTDMPFRNSNGTAVPHTEIIKLVEAALAILEDEEGLSRHQGSFGNFFMEKLVELVTLIKYIFNDC